MKKLNFLLLTIISLFLLVSVNAATVSHPASEITGGTFGKGDFIINNDNEVFLGIKNTEAGGHDYRLVSAGSVGGIGLGKFSIYDSTAGQSRLTIDDSGNIGIGTTNPKTKLDVGGLVRVGRFSSKPTCNTNTIGAFVFDTTIDKPYVCTAAGWKPLDSDFDEDGLIEWLDPNDNSFNPQCSANNGGQCYLSQTSKSSLDGDLAASNIKSGVNIFGVSGTLSDPPSCSANNGGHCEITQSSKSALDSDLVAANIKSGVNIFGVVGTLVVPGSQTFTSSGTFTVPSGITQITVSLVAGGGGGGGGDSPWKSGTSGSDGGASSFGSFIKATGGRGGPHGSGSGGSGGSPAGTSGTGSTQGADGNWRGGIGGRGNDALGANIGGGGNGGNGYPKCFGHSAKLGGGGGGSGGMVIKKNVPVSPGQTIDVTVGGGGSGGGSGGGYRTCQASGGGGGGRGIVVVEW